MEPTNAPPVREFEIRTIVALLRRQSQVLLITTLAVFGLAVVYLLAATQTYTATALVLVDPDNQNILETGTSFPTSAGRDNARVDSEVEILRSDAVALAVIKNENLMADPEFGARLGFSQKIARAVGIANAAPADDQKAIARTLILLKNATTIRRKGLTYLITVSTNSQSPAKAAELANNLSNAYIAQQVQAKINRSRAASDVLNTQILAARMSLASYETAFDQFLDANLKQLDIGTDQAPLSAMRAELESAERAFEFKEQEQLSARRLLQQENWAGLQATLGDDGLGKLVQQRSELLQRDTGNNDATTPQNFQQALSEIDSQLSARSAAALRALSAEVQDIDQNITGLRGQMRRAVLSSDLSASMLTEIYSIQQETSIARAQYDSLLSRMRDLDTQANIQIADSRIVSPALVPLAATFPNRSLVLLIALAASMGLGVSLAFLNEYYVGGVTSASQLSELLQVTTAATIPTGPELKASQLGAADIIVDAPLSVFSESVRKLRAAIDQTFRTMQASGGPSLTGGRTILVTSAMADEGKTTTALSLARTYAQAGRKTLLIDADLRKPSVHLQLGFEPQVGFLDYLRNAAGTDLKGTFYARDPSSDLALIMGAARSEFPTDQLLSGATFEALLSQAKEVYDVVVIDSPPLLPVVDARYIAHHADAVVLVVKWAATGQGDLKSAVQPLRDAMKPGAALHPVLTQVQGGARRSAYGGYGEGYSAAI